MSRSILTLALVATLLPGVAFAKKAPPPPPPAPVEAAPAPVDPEAWRAKPPEAGPAGTWAPPAAKVVTLSNGIPVYLLENPSLPLLSVRLVLTVGREANPAGKGGLAAITADMLDEGTATRSAEQLAADAAMLGAVLYSGSGDETSVVALDALTGDALGPSLDLLADVALHPKFDKKVYARVQKSALSAIQEGKGEPRDVAARAFAAAMFGKDHPYGLPSIGDEASVSAIKVGDVKKFYKTWWHAGNAAFVVSGATNEAEVKSLLDARFGAWAKGETTRPTVAAPATPMKTRVVFVEQPGAVQSVIRLGTTGVSRTAPDYMAANLAGTLFGGMFSSRLNMNLREEHGWSYGAYGGFTDTRDHGLFLARTSVQADKTGPAVAEIVKELVAARSKAPTDAELAMTKEYLLKSLPGNFDTNGTSVGSLSVIPQFGLAADAWKTYVTQATAITPADAAKAATTYFDPARMLIVVVGPKTIEVDDGNGGKTTVDVVKSLKDLGYELVTQ